MHESNKSLFDKLHGEDQMAVDKLKEGIDGMVPLPSARHSDHDTGCIALCTVPTTCIWSWANQMAVDKLKEGIDLTSSCIRLILNCAGGLDYSTGCTTSHALHQ